MKKQINLSYSEYRIEMQMDFSLSAMLESVVSWSMFIYLCSIGHFGNVVKTWIILLLFQLEIYLNYFDALRLRK